MTFSFFICRFQAFQQTCPNGFTRTDCYNACSENTCVNAQNPNRICTADCQVNGPNGNCICANGNYRTNNNQCVPLSQCNATSTCPANFVPTTCYNECTENTCANAQLPNRGCPAYCQTSGGPNGMCVCAGNLYRIDDNRCVPLGQCSTTATTPTATQTPTPTTRPTQSPTQTPTPRPTQTPIQTPPATPTPICPLPNYVPTTCYNACSEKTCANKRKPNQICSRECQLAGGPNGNCVCKAGYIRNDCNECVPEDQCDVDGCSRPNEELITISIHTVCRVPKYCRTKKRCSRKSCKGRKSCHKGKSHRRSNRKKSKRSCRLPKECRCKKEVQECVCKDGFARNRCGVCVPEKQANNRTECVAKNTCRRSN